MSVKDNPDINRRLEQRANQGTSIFWSDKTRVAWQRRRRLRHGHRRTRMLPLAKRFLFSWSAANVTHAVNRVSSIACSLERRILSVRHPSASDNCQCVLLVRSTYQITLTTCRRSPSSQLASRRALAQKCTSMLLRSSARDCGRED